MNGRKVANVTGTVLMIASLLMLLPIITALIYKENKLPFVIPTLCMLLVGVLLSGIKTKKEVLYAKEGFVIVALCWIAISAFGALPFYISEGISFVDALFEAVSGFTTTGSSIFSDVEALPNSILLWRAFSHWIGGMGVLVFTLALMPNADSHSLYLMKAEVPGPQVGKLAAKIKFSSRILYSIYVLMTLLEVLLLAIGGMPLFDSIVNSFATAGTGGFAIKNTSIGAYNSAYFDNVIGVFMMLFGINFNLHYLAITGNIIHALKSEELRWYLSVIGSATLLIAINILPCYDGLLDSFRYSFFQVSSIITTTGFTTTDFNMWPNFSRSILIVLMFIGACAGSTGGGIKISRIILLAKSGLAEMKHKISPRSVNAVRVTFESTESDE